MITDIHHIWCITTNNMTKQEYDNLPVEKKTEALRKIMKGELKITEEPDIVSQLNNMFK